LRSSLDGDSIAEGTDNAVFGLVAGNHVRNTILEGSTVEGIAVNAAGALGWIGG
jgi:hypothetical protein